MEVVRVVAAAAVVGLLLLSCGDDDTARSTTSSSSSTTTTSSTGAGGDAVDDPLPEFEEDLEETRLAQSRADVSIEVVDAPASVSAGGTFSVTVVVTAHDRDFVNAPTVVADLPAGIEAGALPEDCADEGRTLRCRVQPSLVSTGSLPVSSDPFEIPLAVASSASDGVATIDVTAESLDNPVDNDPDPDDNRASVELSITGS